MQETNKIIPAEKEGLEDVPCVFFIELVNLFVAKRYLKQESSLSIWYMLGCPPFQ